jgi:galactose mutarotase-like enzyme
VNVYVENTKKPIVFANGENLTTLPRRGIAIEPQTFVLNHDILRPGEVYQHFISYRFVEK